ncbi:hypothetical protein V1477_002789 [Vespula maculifrons]|uniref:Uncharacterized protein n=1 Tax=Vespula maculifrons TaxID=7453 RepID=A0ABD2CWS1_VESMC
MLYHCQAYDIKRPYQKVLGKPQFKLSDIRSKKIFSDKCQSPKKQDRVQVCEHVSINFLVIQNGCLENYPPSIE